MAKNTSVLVGDHYQQFISSQVDTGRYNSASEVVRAALRLLEEREEHKIQVLRKALEAGENSGLAIPFDNDEFKKEMKAKYVDAG